ncbi:MAG TPA: carboxypeptidase regulatory-like domain-containing protein, partial [Pyrinomonadaceae bacterium]|nr:carboxypeptidase regulatory-like domain-containing protein [Pyrinomonadaceae bacterium]
MPNACARVTVVLAALLLLPCAAPSLAQTDQSKAAPATVTGRVTDGKRGLAGIGVVVMSTDVGMFEPASASAKTDAEGRYRLTGLAPGRYQLAPVAPAHIMPEESFNFIGLQRGRSLVLGPGENIENVDFRLARGGVITGRVTGDDGKPVVGELVQITPEEGNRPAHQSFRLDRGEMLTDDRGVYRVYGLPAGRYRVSVGATGPPRGQRGPSREHTFYQRTYYPGTTDTAQAKSVEVAEGGEATDIDISVSKTTRQTYSASGRLVFADTGQPAANVRVSYGTPGRGGRVIGAGLVWFPGGPSTFVTDARGEFKLEGLAAGRYAAFGVREQGSDWYSDQSAFEIADADAEGIEVKLRRGSSLSGVVHVEGVSDRAAAQRMLSRARIHVMPLAPGNTPMPGGPATSETVAPDGSFRVGGLQAGRVRIGFSAERGANLSMSRVEHNGVPLGREASVEVEEGAQVTGVRVVVAHGNASVRGRINIVGGTLAPGYSLRVFARRVGDENQFGARAVEADSRGSFIMEGVAPGDYEFYAAAFFIVFQANASPPGPRAYNG